MIEAAFVPLSEFERSAGASSQGPTKIVPTMNIARRFKSVSFIPLLMITLGALQAGDFEGAIIDDKAPVSASPWTVCNLFDNTTLYEGDGFIRDVSFTGRYHGQYISQTENESGTTNGFHNWQHRRARLGFDIEFAGDLKLVSSINVSDGSGSSFGFTRGVFFNHWDELYLKWEPDDDTYITFGKTKQKITMENMESSKRILTIERSQIVNEVVAADYPWQLLFGFNLLGIDHELGASVTGADLDSTGERWKWLDPDSRGSLSYRGNLPVSDSTKLYFGYLFTNNSSGFADAAGSADSDQASQYEHLAHLGTKSEWGSLGLVTDLIYAANREASGPIPAGDDTWGVVFLPYYNLTDKLQFVAKYSYMDSGRQQRYQRYFTRQYVDGYHTLYAGLNYYLCGHKLKLMGGYEYASGDEFSTGAEIDSSSWVLAVRTYW